MLTVGSIIYGTALDLDYLGQGVVKMDGYVIFVKGLLKDEYAEIIITQIKKKFAEGKVLKLIQKSPDRVFDTHILGSLDLYHLSLEKQLMWQRQITEDTVKKISQLDLKVEEVITDMKDTYYRNKSVFHVISKPYLELGLYSTDHKLVPTHSLVIAGKKTNELLKLVNQAHLTIERDVLNHIAFRENDLNEVLVTLVASKDTFEGLSDIISLLSKDEKVVGMTLNIKSSDYRILGEKSYTLYGENRIMMPLKDSKIAIDDLSFYQVNTSMMQKTYALIQSMIKPNKHIIDAYAGVGSIGYYLSDMASKISMIESSKASHEKAKAYKDIHHLEHVDLYLEPSELCIKKVEGDIIIIDPPRQGLHHDMALFLKNHRYEQIIYLSCDVKTLARDLNILKESYDIKKVYPIRMFFHTTELETLTLLEPKAI
ncbi:MAG: 23S rRNA (uracil(1939)-C(5))-methyltransferase RlmD [Tenericutes bacterium HGW-Tenericutes-6]|nr:MAG: 23S rRNA (uracil(1939)-C(5))-methyltransferase RlmD [Tenericutes bacterium HGW-Tenericutes-6]